MSDEYPSLKRAIIGNGKAGNLYCGVKWFLWQLFYIVGALFIGVATVLFLPIVGLTKLVQRLGWMTETRPAKAITTVTSNEYVRAGAWYVVMATLAVMVVIIAYMKFYLFTVAVVSLALGIGVMLTLIRIEEWMKTNDISLNSSEKLSRVQQKSMETPVARRIIGYCPVSMKLEPKWFQKIEEWVESI